MSDINSFLLFVYFNNTRPNNRLYDLFLTSFSTDSISNFHNNYISITNSPFTFPGFSSKNWETSTSVPL